ncbi:hypothetical protein AB0M46_13660 [Dactylosporangium sp. NPDC051485]|uniref:hypothetical protein n=1 Tax=Dactylosporangium sp. NPDC051485 TaxID=3154846 RepID=UPI003430AB7D
MTITLNASQPDPRLRYTFGGDSGYETELHLTEALSALVPDSDLAHRDHRLFQLAHVMTEYAWVGIHDALCLLDAALAKDDLVDAGRTLARATSLAELPVSCLRLLTDALPQAVFLQMRGRFAQGATGLDSPGARSLRKAGAAVWERFEQTLTAHGVTLDDLVNATEPGYTGQTSRALLADVMLHLQRLDTRILAWKQGHLTLVWQLLGGHPHATTEPDAASADQPTSMRGRPITDLRRLAARPLFPLLWQRSSTVYHAAETGYS